MGQNGVYAGQRFQAPRQGKGGVFPAEVFGQFLICDGLQDHFPDLAGGCVFAFEHPVAQHEGAGDAEGNVAQGKSGLAFQQLWPEQADGGPSGLNVVFQPDRQAGEAADLFRQGLSAPGLALKDVVADLAPVGIDHARGGNADAQQPAARFRVLLADQAQDPLQLVQHGVVIVAHDLVAAAGQHPAPHVAQAETGAVAAQGKAKHREAVPFQVDQDGLPAGAAGLRGGAVCLHFLPF